MNSGSSDATQYHLDTNLLESTINPVSPGTMDNDITRKCALPTGAVPEGDVLAMVSTPTEGGTISACASDSDHHHNNSCHNILTLPWATTETEDGLRTFWTY